MFRLNKSICVYIYVYIIQVLRKSCPCPRVRPFPMNPDRITGTQRASVWLTSALANELWLCGLALGRGCCRAALMSHIEKTWKGHEHGQTAFETPPYQRDIKIKSVTSFREELNVNRWLIELFTSFFIFAIVTLFTQFIYFYIIIISLYIYLYTCIYLYHAYCLFCTRDMRKTKFQLSLCPVHMAMLTIQ